MAFETEGILHKIFETENKTATFQAREFVIRQDGNYPQFIKFQLTQDRCELISNFNEGDNIKVHFDLRGREWNDKYFTNLNAWKVEASQAPASDPSAAGADPVFEPLAEPVSPQESEDSPRAEDFGDLPF